MATRSAPMLFEEATLCSVWSQTLETYPEVLSGIYTAHYRHVLQVCRRFFRRGVPETSHRPRQKRRFLPLPSLGVSSGRPALH